MKKLKIFGAISIILVIGVLLGSISWFVFGAEPTVKLEGPSTVSAGKEFTLTLTANRNVVGILASVEYNPDQLELVGDITSATGWFTEYNEGTFAAMGSGATTLMKMVFRVKDSVQPEETVSVKLTGIELTDEVPIEGTGDTDYEQIELGDKTWVATVPIPKSSDAMLKTLSVTGYDIDFTPGTRKYYITVPTEVYRVEIEAEANHPKASVDIQNTTLTAGEQTRIKIVVTAEDGSTRTYSVYVTREAPETQPPVPSSDCTLKSLTVVGAELAFAPDKTQYSLEVPFETAELSISAEANDAAATVEVKNTALIAGQTVTVQVVVTAEDGTARTYHLYVTRAAEETSPEDTLPEDTTPEDTNPEDTTPGDTNPEDTDPAGTGSEETNPETRPSGNTPPVGGDDDTDQKIFWLNAIYIIILVGCLMVIAILVVMLVIYRRMNNSSEH